MSATTSSKTTRVMVNAACVVLIVAGLKAAKTLVVPFVLSVFIAIICGAPLTWLKTKKVPGPMAVVLLIVAVASFIFFVGMIIGRSVKDFLRTMPEYQARLKDQSNQLMVWLQEKGVELPEDLFADMLDPSAAMGFIGTLLTELGSLVTDGFLILLAVVFLLLEISSFPKKLQVALPNPEVPLAGMKKFIDGLESYMALKTVISLFTGTGVAVWLSFLGVDYAVLWGLVAFLLNYIPNLGSIISAVPAVLLALVQLGPTSALLTAGGYVFVNVFFGNIVEPKVMGEGMGLSTLVVFFSLLFWGWVLGPVGMLLSVPLTMTLKIALESSEDTRWIAILLGTGTAREIK